MTISTENGDIDANIYYLISMSVGTILQEWSYKGFIAWLVEPDHTQESNPNEFAPVAVLFMYSINKYNMLWHQDSNQPVKQMQYNSKRL